MGTRKLETILNPKRIAVIGVTINPNSVGGKVLTNLVVGGFGGVVYPVNAESEAVMGIPCYKDVRSLPKTPDLAVICSAAKVVPGLIRECGEAGIHGVIIVSAGFKETGDEGKILEGQIRAEASRFPEMRILGPNCLGVILPALRLNCSFAGGMPKAGNIAFISQSGALCTSVLDWAIDGKIGFSAFVSIGNSLDVDFGDLIDYLGDDMNTHSIILYVESITDARKFMTAARAFARAKPILVYKAGRFPESASAAASHTGAMASEDAVYDAAFHRIGITRVDKIGEIFDCAELLGRNKIPLGSRLGIITNAGGPGVMATDALLAAKGSIARLSAETLAQLNESLPPSWSHGNPVDVLGDANSKRIEKAARAVVADPGVDALLAILTPQAMTNPTAAAKVVAAIQQSTHKPVLAAWIGGQSMREGIRLLKEGGVAAYRTPEQAIRAFMTLVAYSENLKTLYETPKDFPVEFEIDRQAHRLEYLKRVAGAGPVLSEALSKELLRAYGIPVIEPIPARSAAEAAKIAGRMGFPVVLKILSPDITHKTDVGGVALNLDSPKAVESAYARMLAEVSKKAGSARLEGVTVQRMANPKDGVELILGIKRDSIFGTVMMAGMGGIGAELLGERILGFPPLNERLAHLMLEPLKIWPLLQGYRGRPPMNTPALVEALIRLSCLAADFPEIAELDINPLLVTPEEVIALDARVVLGSEGPSSGADSTAHLALHPYPEKYIRRFELKDGTPITFRPIRPEDEPLWMEMLKSCSKETIYSRFRSFFNWASHEVAIRYCYIDYDREIAIVAELGEGANPRLIGVGRLIADPDKESVEYAVLITDEWQKKELGSLLTDYCIEIASKWGIRRMVAETTSENRPMISVFKKRAFSIRHDAGGSTVVVEKELCPPAAPLARM